MLKIQVNEMLEILIKNNQNPQRTCISMKPG